MWPGRAGRCDQAGLGAATLSVTPHHALHDVVDIGEVARVMAVLNTSIGSPLMILSVNMNIDMSGRPHGP